jgi:hypothetical protein
MTSKTMTTMTPERIADTCEDAAELVETGWEQGEWYSPEYTNRLGQKWPARYCVEGALAAALGFDVATLRHDVGVRELRTCDVYREVAATVKRRYPGMAVGAYLPGWNDAPDTVKQEVLDVLHETAKRVLGVEP